MIVYALSLYSLCLLHLNPYNILKKRVRRQLSNLKKSARIICSRLEYTVVATCLKHARQHPSKPLTVRLMSLCTDRRREHWACLLMGRLANICLPSQYARLRISVPRIGGIQHASSTRFAQKAVTSQYRDPKARFSPAAALRVDHPRIWGRNGTAGDNRSTKDVRGEQTNPAARRLKALLLTARISPGSSRRLIQCGTSPFRVLGDA